MNTATRAAIVPVVALVLSSGLSLADDALDPARYFVVPIEGVVGAEITAETIERAMKAGLDDEKTILVLAIDSPGGIISECEKIIDLLSEQRARRTIAYVKSALSAAAVIALACDEIYMHRDASIGAATAVEQTEKGLKAADEKVQSVWRSTCRRAAEIGGHSSLFAEAMVDPGVQLRVVDSGGTKKIERVITPSQEDLSSGRMVTVKGRLLTATAAEASRSGLALGVVGELEEISRVGFGLVGWREVNDRGVRIMKAHAARHKSDMKKIEKDLKTAGEHFDRAVEFDPNRQTYTVTNGNRFTPASRVKWVRYSKACYDHLSRCEKALGRASKLGEKYPIFEVQAAFIKERQEEIKAIRERIKRGARRAGV